MFGLDVGQKANTPKIYAQHRHFAARKPPCHAKHGSIAAKNNNKINLFCCIGWRINPRTKNRRYVMALLAQPLGGLVGKGGGPVVPCLVNQKNMSACCVLHTAASYVIKTLTASLRALVSCGALT